MRVGAQQPYAPVARLWVFDAHEMMIVTANAFDTGSCQIKGVAVRVLKLELQLAFRLQPADDKRDFACPVIHSLDAGVVAAAFRAGPVLAEASA